MSSAKLRIRNYGFLEVYGFRLRVQDLRLEVCGV